MNELGIRILNFYNFLFVQCFQGGIVWHDNLYHVTVLKDGNIYSYGEEPTLTAALDECIVGLKKGGF